MRDHIAAMLAACGTSDGVLPPTELFNEGWMLRCILDWFSHAPEDSHPLSFSPGCYWFSEALLPSQFLPCSRRDALAESWTHADGVIGHFAIGNSGKGDLSFRPDGSHLVVCEAKLFSKLSAGVKNAPSFDQAARNVACVADVLRRAKVAPSSLDKLGFYVIAPTSQIKEGVFYGFVKKASIRRKVSARLAQYNGKKDAWLSEWFEPTLKKIEISCLSWEGLVAHIRNADAAYGRDLAAFYQACLQYNQQN